MNKVAKIIIEVVLLAAICGLVYLLYSNIMKPVNFNKERDSRKAVAVQRLQDIRTLQVAYKSVTGKFNSSVDSLKQFYENGQMEIVMQIGSMDDSLAVMNTEAIKKANKKLKPEQLTEKLKEAYAAGQKVVFSSVTKIPVRDTLFNNRPDFCIDSLKYNNLLTFLIINKNVVVFCQLEFGNSIIVKTENHNHMVLPFERILEPECIVFAEAIYPQYIGNFRIKSPITAAHGYFLSFKPCCAF